MKKLIKIKRILSSNSKFLRVIDKIIRLIISVLIVFYEFLIKILRRQYIIEDVKNDIKHILILGYYGLGDVLMTTPGIRGLKYCFPSAKIIVVTTDVNKPIFESNPYIDLVMVVAKEDFFSSAKKIRDFKIDLFVMFSAVFEYYLYGILVRSRFKIGYLYNYKRVCASGFKIPKILNKEINPSIRSTKICEAFGVKVTAAMDFTISSVDDALFSLFNQGPDLKIGINPNKTKLWLGAGEWSIEKWAILSRNISNFYSASFILFGGPQDIDYTNELYKLVCNDVKVINVAGKTTIKDVAFLLSKLSLFITVEGGLMHLAQALNVPTVSIFTFTDVESFKTGTNNFVVNKKVECNPCVKNHFYPTDNYVSICKNNYKCSQVILPEHVFSMCKTILEKT